MSDPKAILLSTWRQLVQRKLAPVAIVLVGAIVAIPVLLAKNPPAAPAPAPVKHDAGAANPATATPIVTLASDAENARRRRVLGSSKNPFTPAPVKIAAVKTTTAVTAVTTPGLPNLPTGGSTTSGGTATTPAAPAPSTSTPATGTTPAPPKKYELYSIAVRFGDSSSDTLDKINLGRDKPLPDAKNPILVYLGVEKGAKRAIFMVDSSVTPQGDGTCAPSPADCETVHLHEGDTEFFDVKDATGNVTAQYELDLVKIRTATTTSASKAAKSRASVSAAGRRAVRAHEAKVGPLRYRYDAATGTVERLGAKAWKATLARTAGYFSN
jgi:hypothetical protein